VLAQVKTLPKGHPVSYGLQYVTSGETRIGVVPQGYSDGFDRSLSNRGEVLVGGRRCPVIGRVAMNMFMVDLSAVPQAVAGDEVVLLGSQGADAVTAEEMATAAETINYEVVARLSALLARRVVE
jgi:alanine racemase